VVASDPASAPRPVVTLESAVASNPVVALDFRPAAAHFGTAHA